jgi:outer membrane protein assembly factor BamB
MGKAYRRRFAVLLLLTMMLPGMLLAACRGENHGAKAGEEAAGAGGYPRAADGVPGADGLPGGAPDDGQTASPLAIGDAFEVRLAAPMTGGPNRSGNAPRAKFYAAPGETYTVTGTQGEWLAVDSTAGVVWTSAWYGTPEAAHAEPVLMRLELPPDAELSLHPGSAWKTTVRDAAGASGSDAAQAYAILEWEDWYGVVLPSDRWHDEEGIVRPVLLWTGREEAAGAMALEDGLFGADGPPFMDLWQIAEAALYAGMNETELMRMLGRPDAKESSRALNETGEPLRIGTEWRYEPPEGLLAVSLDERNRLVSWSWRIPVSPEELAQIRGSYPYHADFRASPPEPVPSAEPEWIWRHRGTLAFNYLLGATDEALLLRGDDGGFSGFHNDSGIYALNRETGALLWRIDAGFGWADAIVDPERGEAAVLTHYDPEAGRYEERIRRLRLRDGAVLWEEAPSDGHGRLHLASGAVIYAVQPENMPDRDSEGRLRVYDAATGRLMWERGYAESFRVLSRPKDPYVLVRHGRTLAAYRPGDGGLAWELAVGSPPDSGPLPYESMFTDLSGNRLSANSRNRWVVGSGLALIDMAHGGVKAVYPIKPDEYVTAIDDRRLLVVRPSDDDPHRQTEHYETVLYDVPSGKERWSRPGFGSGAAVSGGRVYLLLDGVPTAVDPESGETVWQAALAGCSKPGWRAPWGPVVAGDALLAPCDGDLIVLRLADGKGVHRLRDVRLDYPEGREEDTRSGLINLDASGDLYIGSANGYFSRLRLP